ncbi:hypothetical protein [Candidatus Poriferisodalis sp.]|uniref:hypothetical protein n=1 Tax=Candidatus Poriferisodalis sp. TaxID=3101277 RepID=UPI003B51A33B
MSTDQLRLDADTWRKNPTALGRVGRKLSMVTAAALLLLGSIGVTLAFNTDDVSAHPGEQLCWIVRYETVQWGSQPYQQYEQPVYWCHYLPHDHPESLVWEILFYIGSLGS